MRSLNIIFLLFTILLMSLPLVTLAQMDSDKQIEIKAEQQSEFDDITKELDYTDKVKRWRLKKSDEIEEEKEEAIDIPRFSIDGNITNAIAYIAIIVLIMAVLFMIFNNANRQKKVKIEDVDDDYIEDIEEVNTIDGFKAALNAGDYRSAIRMQFIRVLQILQENNSINWRPEKTNKDYLRELSGTNLKSEFRELSGIYELVWYGNTKIERDSFEQLNPAFDKFINNKNET